MPVLKRCDKLWVVTEHAPQHGHHAVGLLHKARRLREYHDIAVIPLRKQPCAGNRISHATIQILMPVNSNGTRCHGNRRRRPDPLDIPLVAIGQVVVDGLLYILKQRLQKGETVQLGDLGHFQAVIGSKGTKLESDFNASLIKRPRIVFRPSVTLKSVTGLAKFEKIVPDAPAPGGGDSESPDEI